MIPFSNRGKTAVRQALGAVQDITQMAPGTLSGGHFMYTTGPYSNDPERLREWSYWIDENVIKYIAYKFTDK